MIQQLTNDIWFGNEEGVQECAPSSVINVAHRCRPEYWQTIREYPWRTWFFHVGQPDAETVEDSYLNGLSSIVDSIRLANKFPLFTHCHAGRHRGPTAALFAYWHLNGRTKTALDWAFARTVELSSRYAREDLIHRTYRKMTLDYCRRNSV